MKLEVSSFLKRDIPSCAEGEVRSIARANSIFINFLVKSKKINKKRSCIVLIIAVLRPSITLPRFCPNHHSQEIIVMIAQPAENEGTSFWFRRCCHGNHKKSFLADAHGHLRHFRRLERWDVIKVLLTLTFFSFFS